MTLPEPINIETIKRMRTEHRYAEADALVKAFRASCGRQHRQETKELMRVHRQQKRTLKLCTIYKCMASTTTHAMCDEHRAKYRGMYKARTERPA